MNAKTLEALRGSIAKWEGRAAGGYLKANAQNCPLCQLFNRDNDSDDDDCRGCPVYEATEQQYCEGTPCEEYFDNHNSVAIAKKEVAFLKSLLPSTASDACEPQVNETL